MHWLERVGADYVTGVLREHLPWGWGERPAPVPEREGRAIGRHYDAAPTYDPDPSVRLAYDALRIETAAQYRACLAAGISFEPWRETGQPYADSPSMVRDVREHRHLWYFRTAEGFGTERPDMRHPLLAPWRGAVLYNDLFRCVHDVFGHAMFGNTFGPRGEHNAWLCHRRMFSRLARPAMGWETRGQNSWVNFGPHIPAENPPPLAERPYAAQKIGILPSHWS